MRRDKRAGIRVEFRDGYAARISARDGSWQRRCFVADISQTGARLVIEGTLAGLDLADFYLLLSRTGNAHRRCRKVWAKDDQIGISFVQTPQPASSRHLRSL